MADGMKPPMGAEADLPGGSAADDVWLRGNVRPAVSLLIAAVCIAAGVGTAIVVLPLSPSLGWLLGAVAALLVAAAVALAWSAALPRLTCQGAAVVVRLSPLATHHVPLDVVECVFPGSQPVASGKRTLGGDDPDGEAAAERRVNTLVLRLAERATDWRSKPVAAAWGSWSDGNIVFDGRWCEPLSPEVARGISARLLEAKRQFAGGER
jgi:hypothetical protein